MSYTAIILIATTILGCNSQTTVQQLGKSIEKFTGELYKKVYTVNSGNLIFSGLSVDEIFSLLAEGAKGETKNEILDGLSALKNDNDRRNAFKSLTSNLAQSSEGQKIITANKLYPADNFPILRSFKDIATSDYGAEVENLNYSNTDAAVNTINNWVEQKTNNRIKNILSSDEISQQTKLILVNTLYFKGNWSKPLRSIGVGNFNTLTKIIKKVEYIAGTVKAKFRHCGYFQAKYLELDFQGEKTSMTFILPDNITGLAKLEEKMDEVLEVHSMKEGFASVQLPKFTIETKLDLVPILKKLGISKVFTDRAELSGISSANGLLVDQVAQKAFIDVNEFGVEAAAATSVGITPTSVVEPEFEFKADHPFLYYIRDTASGAVLFAGRFSG